MSIYKKKVHRDRLRYKNIGKCSGLPWKKKITRFKMSLVLNMVEQWPICVQTGYL